jgi:Pyruvate/2-oxoacid:ferredoxin oxidoreductase delta subunit
MTANLLIYKGLFIVLMLFASSFCPGTWPPDSISGQKRIDSIAKVYEDEVFGAFEDFKQQKNKQQDCSVKSCPHYNECTGKNKDNEAAADTQNNKASQADDAFGAFEDFDAEADFGNEQLVAGTSNAAAGEKKWAKRNKLLLTSLGILLATIIAGILMRIPSARWFRPVFLIVSVVYLGFIAGACPCMISSLQDVVLLGLGKEPNWIKTIWFIGLVPLTYIFGKVWCGWVCHLGALQEFLFINSKQSILQSEKSQRVLRFVRTGLLVVLIGQLLITQTNEFCKIDPFLVAFNLRSATITGYVLLVLLLVSSLFIHRPFCRAACPIGLMLGWVEKIPGAAIIGKKDSCTSCASCLKACKIKAIARDDKKSKLENQECIMCGDCLDSCINKSLFITRKSKKHPDKVEL